jgi:tetratricopeptide (TPR) repeat protein
MKGLRADWDWEPHLDLLPVSRRLWRGHFESCRLGCLEEEVLGFYRENDIPGHAIPPLYVRFLRERRLSLLEPVISHNAWDVASLAALAVSVCRIVESGEDLNLEEGVDFESAARVFAAAEEETLSLQCYREAFIRDLPPERRLAAGLSLAAALKSRGLPDEAAEIWKELRRDFPRERKCRIELAKYLEHRCGDFAAALECAGEAMKIVSRECLSRGGGRAPRSLEAECRRRVERLKGKVLREKRRRKTGKGR